MLLSQVAGFVEVRHAAMANTEGQTALRISEHKRWRNPHEQRTSSVTKTTPR